MAHAASLSEEVLAPGCKQPLLQLKEITLAPAGAIPLSPGDLHFCTCFSASKLVAFLERFGFQQGGREARRWQQRAHGTYMISVRLQLLPTGLISMLSYFLGLM